MAHDHDCFQVIQQSAKTMGGRVGHFLYVGNGKANDAHYHGNTAFAAGVFTRLAEDVIATHTPGKCDHCDAVAMALTEAFHTFTRIMRSNPGEC